MDSYYGVALDIGTTTIAGYLWDMEKGIKLVTAHMSNPQRNYGADVISRIQFAGESPENLNVLRHKVVDSINEIITHITSNGGIGKEDVFKVALVGNATMSHIVMGIDPSPLAYAPFKPVFKDLIQGRARDLGVIVNEDAQFFILPAIGGHVGSDITAGLIASDVINWDNAGLLLDVGTNGEIVVGGNGRFFACSTAAGPAFEGVGISSGMRAITGAISKMDFERDVLSFETIDNATPLGICGSGIVDGVAGLLKKGVIDGTGRMFYPGEKEIFPAKYNLSKEYLNRVKIRGGSPEFFVANGGRGKDIVITQKDIRQVQLAKGAIGAGINIVMKELGICADDLERIFIAGAFGNLIEKDSAMVIGLIPEVASHKVVFLGNAAGLGAGMALVSDKRIEEACGFVRDIEHLELSTHPDFQDEYIKAMDFQGVTRI
ncbi:MAG: ASKHA domain-containing protein [Anaerovoracaceae bacterium]|jgi:uncharacterized 2Fe-2S/4Fe-4S cluster protein (DUF4445 family)